MSLTTICSAIKTIGAAISGITAAIDPPPAGLVSAQMPALYVFSGPATTDWASQGDEGGVETRLYRVRVAIAPEAEATPPLLETRIRTLLPAVRDAFAARPSLGSTVGVVEARVLGDSGPIALPEYNAVGFELRLEVQDLLLRTFASGE